MVERTQGQPMHLMSLAILVHLLFLVSARTSTNLEADTENLKEDGTTVTELMDDVSTIKVLYRDFAVSSQRPQQTHPRRPTHRPYPAYRTPRVPTNRTTTTRRPYRHHPTGPPPPRPTRTPPPDQPDICGMTFDAVSVIRGELFIFKGKNMWKMSSIGHLYGPSLIQRFWQGLPETIERIDAAYEKQVSPYTIKLFSGNQYWVFNGNRLIQGPIHLTHLGIPSNVHQVDGVLPWGHTGKTFFFSHDLYWKYDEALGQMEHGYPKSIDHWKGVEYPINSVIRWKDGKTYFFKDRFFWSFNDTAMEVEHSNGMVTNNYWFGCPTTDKHTQEQDNSTNSGHLKGHDNSTNLGHLQGHDNSVNSSYSAPTDDTSAINKVHCSNTTRNDMFTFVRIVYSYASSFIIN